MFSGKTGFTLLDSAVAHLKKKIKKIKEDRKRKEKKRQKRKTLE